MQQILQAALAYYSDNNHWPADLPTLVRAGYLPRNADDPSHPDDPTENPWGQKYSVPSLLPPHYFELDTTLPTDLPHAGPLADRVAAQLPLATSLVGPPPKVISWVTPPPNSMGGGGMTLAWVGYLDPSNNEHVPDSVTCNLPKVLKTYVGLSSFTSFGSADEAWALWSLVTAMDNSSPVHGPMATMFFHGPGANCTGRPWIDHCNGVAPGGSYPEKVLVIATCESPAVSPLGL